MAYVALLPSLPHLLRICNLAKPLPLVEDVASVGSAIVVNSEYARIRLAGPPAYVALLFSLALLSRVPSLAKLLALLEDVALVGGATIENSEYAHVCLAVYCSMSRWYSRLPILQGFATLRSFWGS